MKEQHGADSESEKHAEPRRSLAGYIEPPDHQKQKQCQKDHAAEKSPLFRKNGKSEIGVTFGKKRELGLRAFHETFTPEPPAADGDFRLDDVVPGAQRVAFRVEEGQDALFLIVMQ